MMNRRQTIKLMGGGLLMQSGVCAVAAGKARHIDKVFMHKGRAGKQAVGVGLFGRHKRFVEAARGQSVELWLQRLRLCNTGLNQLTRANIAAF